MPTVLGSLLLGSPLACGSLSSPEPVEPCVRVYHSTVESLKGLLVSSGMPDPRFPALQDYLSRCQALPLDDAERLCLAPEVALDEPERCAEPLARPEVAALSSWFAEQVLPAHTEPMPQPPAAPSGEPPMVQPTVPPDEPKPSPNPIGGPP